MPIDLKNISSGYNLSAINENFQKIEEAWDEKLDRLVSQQGNQMEQDLDLNGHKLLNASFDSNAFDPFFEEYEQVSQEFLGNVTNLKNETKGFRDEAEGFSAIAATSARIANSSANIKSEFEPGVTNALQGETWIYEGSFWYALTNTSVTPSESSNDWVSLSKHNALAKRDEQGAHPASAIDGISSMRNELAGGVVYPSEPEKELQEGDIVPQGVTRLRVNGKIYAMHPTSEGLVTAINETSVTIGEQLVKLNPSLKQLFVSDFGAVMDGVTDDRGSIQRAVDFAASLPRGAEIIVTGTCLINGVISSDGLLNGIVVPFNNIYTPTARISITGGGTLLAGSNNMVLIRASRPHSEVIGMTLDANGKTGVWAMGCVQENRNNTTVLTSQTGCKLIDSIVLGCEEGYVMEPGPTVLGAQSGAFYPAVKNNVFRDNTRAVWLKESLTDGTNRPTRGNLHFNQIERGNTGIDLEYATETTCIGNNFEFINSGTSPNVTPSAYRFGAKTENTVVLGGIAEACSYDINNESNFSNNVVINFSLSGVNYRRDFLNTLQPHVVRLTNRTSENESQRFEAKNPSFGAIVFDYLGNNSKNAAIELNSTRIMEWFNGATKHKGSVADLTLNADGRSISSTAFLRLTAGTDAVYMGVGGNDIYRFSSESIRPTQDNVRSLGEPSLRNSVVYAGTGSINTSDEREKTELLDITEKERLVAIELKNAIKKYKFKDAVNKKGELARIHFGIGAQTVEAIFDEHGLKANNYGLFCYDEWDDTYTTEPAVLDELTGKVLIPEREVISMKAGNRRGIRYDELLCFIIAAM